MELKEYIEKLHKFPLIENDREILDSDLKIPLRDITSHHVSKEDYLVYEKDMDCIPDYDIEPKANTAIHGPQGKKGSYDGIKFDSVWEYAYYRWKKDVKGEYVERNRTENFPYFIDGRERKFYPDFKVSTGVVEVKGIFREKDLQKQAAHPEVEFIDSSKIKPIIKELNKELPDWRKDYIAN